ncbi:MAG: hypothetical protein H8D84_01895 [Proteobacteria bacterium]|nr:hypothetical protein [Pseudomonadota bacterium]
MNHIVCVKWGNKYISQYVNVLYNMVKRQTTVPFEFHCITDDIKGLDPHIKTIKLPNDPWIKTWWSKLWMFGGHFPLQGNILYFDLDVIVFKNIDELFNYNPDKFMIIRDFNRCRIKDWKLCNSSVMRWKTGTVNYLWDDFVSKPNVVMGDNHGDQDWITKRAKQDINHWPDDWIRSYKWEMIGYKDTKARRGPKLIFDRPPKIIEANKVAVFHGEPKPFNCGDAFVEENWK